MLHCALHWPDLTLTHQSKTIFEISSIQRGLALKDTSISVGGEDIYYGLNCVSILQIHMLKSNPRHLRMSPYLERNALKR